MNRKIMAIISSLLICTCIAGCSQENVVGMAADSKEYQSQLTEFIKNVNDGVGTNMPRGYAISDKYTVMASHFGLFVMDTDSATMNCYVDLKKYDCNYFQGDVITEIRLDKEQENIYFYNGKNYNPEDKVSEKVYKLNIKSKEIIEVTKEDIPKEEDCTALPERRDFLEVLDEANEVTKAALTKYKEVNRSGFVDVYDNRTVFTVTEEWKLSKLKVVFVDMESGEVKELPVISN